MTATPSRPGPTLAFGSRMAATPLAGRLLRTLLLGGTALLALRLLGLG